ncbi:phosphatidylinositol-4-phosphate 5-kinase [Reticulomyxa filosa]|uniref:Phosphatidylinositol-4-phosphate 5-kinase n=1 Tax=Reticulomyxa filosa TaxID=46433 RepID=X6LYN8_RETFI|nr:phosphatidylinositol-4-phosphate 5-kinase [Reticulomyxa filosa]|eukprot:ETO06744.1 phosphatidylinositol-4-phosphate 5-kinase [Reticulomyxa filosa]
MYVHLCIRFNLYAFSRHIKLKGKLMKDEDLKKALLLDPQESSDMYRRLRNDTRFLMKQNVMDYSLLLGIYYVGVYPAEIILDPHQSNEDHVQLAQSNQGVQSNQAVQPGPAAEKQDNNDNTQVPSFANQISESLSIQFPKSLKTKQVMPEDLGIKPFQRPRAPTFATSLEAVGLQQDAVHARIIEGPGIYFVGIIDMLQSWNTEKKVENFSKTYFRCKDKNGVSCVEPKFYRKRFLRKMFMIGIRPKPNEDSSETSDED